MWSPKSDFPNPTVPRIGLLVGYVVTADAPAGLRQVSVFNDDLYLVALRNLKAFSNIFETTLCVNSIAKSTKHNGVDYKNLKRSE